MEKWANRTEGNQHHNNQTSLKRIVKYITSKTLQPMAARYISRQRVYRFKGITIEVPKTVFHPALFFSTRLLLGFMEGIDVAGKSFLELGAGSGLIALSAAQRGAAVTATDINKIAVEYLHKNSGFNNIDISIILSDLFIDIPTQRFEIIAINPPYYKKNPVNDAELAWFCGKGSEYFYKLFETLGGYVDESSEVYMILCEGCDIELIKNIAAKNNYRFVLMMERKKLWEMHYIFKIELIPTKDA